MNNIKTISKEKFQKLWGNAGYWDDMKGWGIGFQQICNTTLYPFINKDMTVLEIGPGGGIFTNQISKKCKNVIAIDVVKKSDLLKSLNLTNLTYIELSNMNYECKGVEDNSIDFCYTHGVFCHLHYGALTEYLKNVSRVLKKGSDFVFMITNFNGIKHLIPPIHNKKYNPGDHLGINLYYQDKTTLKSIYNPKEWKIISENMLPTHRDIFIHLRKK